VRTIVDEVEEQVFVLLDRRPVRVEGLNDRQWVLMDYGDVVVHVFADEARRFYEIERLYKDVPQVEWKPVTGEG
jgi:ribosome-associated protein